jgi:3-phosphoglycerate kinase
MGQSYQLMTFDTDQGPIQVPVDVQAASKMADETQAQCRSLRAIPTTAERRREASQTIAKLEQQIRESNEERDFYRHERTISEA